MVKNEINYFEASGPRNTDEVLKLARRKAEVLGIRNIVVASTSGDTGIKACEIFKGFDLVVVGEGRPAVHLMNKENKEKILSYGAKLFVGGHALSGIERSIRRTFNTIMPLEIMAHTLRLFGEGTKVCIEITIMAADAGLIPTDEEVIAIAGTGSGADTALVIKPASSPEFFDLDIREIIAKPRRIRK